jgi:hypothetical protein
VRARAMALQAPRRLPAWPWPWPAARVLCGKDYYRWLEDLDTLGSADPKKGGQALRRTATGTTPHACAGHTQTCTHTHTRTQIHMRTHTAHARTHARTHAHTHTLALTHPRPPPPPPYTRSALTHRPSTLRLRNPSVRRSGVAPAHLRPATRKGRRRVLRQFAALQTSAWQGTCTASTRPW